MLSLTSNTLSICFLQILNFDFWPDSINRQHISDKMDIISKLASHNLFHVFDKIAETFSEKDLLNFAHTSRRWRQVVENYELFDLVSNQDETAISHDEIDKGTRVNSHLSTREHGCRVLVWLEKTGNPDRENLISVGDIVWWARCVINS